MWSVYGASVQGAGHIRHELPCQDAHGWEIIGHEHFVIAIADGLGSAAKAEQGAQLAVTHALTVLKQSLSSTPSEHLDDQKVMITEAFSQARQCLLENSLKNNRPLSEYATTLLLAILQPNGFVAGQIGDGIMVALLEDDSLVLANSPQRGEYVNETIPLTAEDALPQLSISSYQGKMKAFAALTDGLQELAFNHVSEEAYTSFFTPFFERVFKPSFDSTLVSNNLADFLSSERVCSRTDDDKTLLIAGYTKDVVSDRIM